MLAHTPESREIKKDCWARRDDDDGPVMSAYRMYIISRQGFSGKYEGSWGHRLCKRSDWVGAIRVLPDICNRLDDVQIEHDSWEHIIDRYDTPDTFFYLVDPPYVPETRRSGKYTHEMTAEDHVQLVDRLKSVEGMALLSGYNHIIYEGLGWKRKDYDVACSAVEKYAPPDFEGRAC